MYYIYFHNWWNGFFNGYDANNINFFYQLFKHTILKDFIVTNDINQANVLVEAGKPEDGVIRCKDWKYKINFIGEPVFPDHEKYDLVLTSVNRIENIVDLPVSVMYILGNNYLQRLVEKRNITTVPSRFCCFVVSNPKCLERNKMFKLLNNYKKVDSCGRYENNSNYYITGLPWWSQEYINFISQYKFMICFENTKMETYSTEKIVNAYLAGIAPIYWSSHSVKSLFNTNSLLYLEDESEESYSKLIDRIVELDNNDTKYLEFINNIPMDQSNIEYWNTNYSYEALGKKINIVLGSK